MHTFHYAAGQLCNCRATLLDDERSDVVDLKDVLAGHVGGHASEPQLDRLAVGMPAAVWKVVGVPLQPHHACSRP